LTALTICPGTPKTCIDDEKFPPRPWAARALGTAALGSAAEDVLMRRRFSVHGPVRKHPSRCGRGQRPQLQAPEACPRSASRRGRRLRCR
jgi:hypothetical protein